MAAGLTLDRNSLQSACFAVARNTMWDRRPMAVDAISEVAKRFFCVAIEHEEFIVGQGRDPNLITRAVAYLAHTHAIPPMRDDTRWFSDMLGVLLELACPNTGVPQEFDRFYQDIEEGIASSRSDFT